MQYASYWEFWYCLQLPDSFWYISPDYLALWIYLHVWLSNNLYIKQWVMCCHSCVSNWSNLLCSLSFNKREHAWNVAEKVHHQQAWINRSEPDLRIFLIRFTVIQQEIWIWPNCNLLYRDKVLRIPLLSRKHCFPKVVYTFCQTEQDVNKKVNL